MFLKMFFIFCFDLPDPDHQLPFRDQPKYACLKGAENLSSIDYFFA
jgi:hypothetical protein